MAQRVHEEVEEIARVLARQQEKTLLDVWQKALTLHRVRYDREVLEPPEPNMRDHKKRECFRKV